MLSKARVLVVGDAMLDRYWFGAVERLSPEAPVPVVLIEREEERPGGAANVALNVQLLGVQATLLTVMGEDDPARRLKALLDKHSVTSLIGLDPALYTTVKLRVVGRSQQMLRVDFESRPQQLVLSQMLSAYGDALQRHDAVLFSDYGKGGLADVAQMIRSARAAGKLALVDPKGSDYERYAGASVITPNRAELAQVVGAWSSEAVLHERAHTLRQRLGLAALVLTRSEEGISVFDNEGHVRFEAQARQVFDVTGAGDTVIATLSALLASGMALRDAVPIANRAGGIVVGKFGTAGVSYAELFAH
jgi:rfaE bifunctional protein kinase chain/domain